MLKVTEVFQKSWWGR